MLPIQILNLLLLQSSQLRIDIFTFPLAIIPAHPHQQCNTHNQNRAARREVQSIPDGIIRCIRGQEAPSTDEPADIPQHDVGAYGGRASSVRDDVCGDVRVAESSVGKGSDGNDESCAVASRGVVGGEEHDVADHHERSRGDEVDGAFVGFGGEERDEDCSESADDVGWDCAELLLNDGLLGVNRLDDGRGEKGQTLHGDVVEEEDEGCGEGDGVEDAEKKFLVVDLVENHGGANTLGLDAGNGEFLFIGAEPAGGFRAVGEGDESYQGEPNGDDTFNAEDHAPGGEAAEVVEGENSRSEEPTECACKGSHDNVEGEAEGELATAVPA